MTTTSIETRRGPTPAQQEAIDELALAHAAVGITWELPLGTLIIVAACFDYPDICANCGHHPTRHGGLSLVCHAPGCICSRFVELRRPVETARYRILTNGLVLAIPEHHRARDIEITYPVEELADNAA